MTTTSALRTPFANHIYRIAHTKLSKFLRIYHDELISFGYLEDLDDYLLLKVSPAFGSMIPVLPFEDALAAYGDVRDVMDGSSAEIIRNDSGTVNNTLELLADKQDLLDMRIREVLNAIGVQ